VYGLRQQEILKGMAHMPVNYKEIGGRIKSRRKKEGMSQKELGERIGYCSAYISQIERGITKINLNILSRIADELGCDMAEFVRQTSIPSAGTTNDLIVQEVFNLSDQEKYVMSRMLRAYFRARDEVV
jgi:transcriptional regulator with XRE-family HTH domain